MSRNDLPPSSLRRGFRVPPRRQGREAEATGEATLSSPQAGPLSPPRGDQPRSPSVPSHLEVLSCRETRFFFLALSREGRPRPHNISAKISIVFCCFSVLRSAANERASLRREARSRRPSVPAPWRGPLEPEVGWSKPPSAHPRDRVEVVSFLTRPRARSPPSATRYVRNQTLYTFFRIEF